jgi:hypothetical protein
VAPAALATTYCVQDPACPQGGVAENTVADAVQAADANGVDGDTVRIGPGTFDTASVGVDTPMEITGAGIGATVLRNTGPGYALLLASSSSAADLDVLLTQTNSEGLRTQDGSDITRVRVRGPHALTGVGGFILEEPGSVVQGAVVDLGGALDSVAVFDADGGGLILDSTLIDGIGIQSGGTTATTARRLTMLTGVGALIVGGSLNLTNTLIAPHPTGSSIFTGVDVSQSSDGTRPGVLNASHLTVVGNGLPGFGVIARSNPNGSLVSGAVDATVSNSIIRNVSTSLERSADPFPESVDLTVRYSAYDGTKVIDQDGGANNGAYVDTEGNIKDSPDPLFLDPAASNYRLRFDSPLLDLADPAPPSLLDALDLARLPRLRDSDGNGNNRRDMGAYEYQRAAPIASFTVSPPTALFGDLTTFDASPSSDPDGDPISYEWALGDGATASGVSASHGYATPGAYPVTLTVRDATGLTGTAQTPATLALRTGACANEQTGGAAADVLTGFGAGDLIRGAGGNDHIRGLAGDDCLRGDAGKDRAEGGAGRDRLNGGAGGDRLNGGAGGDRLNGGAGRDRLAGGSGADRIKAGGGDRVDGGAGNDRIDAANGKRDRVNCGKGRRDRVRADRKDRLRGCERVRMRHSRAR